MAKKLGITESTVKAYRASLTKARVNRKKEEKEGHKRTHKKTSRQKSINLARN
jgi:DNA-binding CsgD family transcriptional regulator